ncbi:GDSL-type esterase/lipase family protein [Synoicihabitans lomoniglobus]|nr:GDSL-type esterase/lipase family protein [Opitutaceae bacterium LMO-M01]
MSSALWSWAAERVKPTDPRIAIIGRTAVNDTGVVMAYPAITLRFRYRGAAPTVHLNSSNADNSFNLSCNGWQPVTLRLHDGANTIALPTGDAPAEGWIIELVRRNEAWMGVSTFTGLTIPDGGELLPAPVLPERKLLLIGDSAACGEFIERFPPEDISEHPRAINAGRSFGVLLGKALDAQVHVVAYGGRGVVMDWAGRTATNNAPQFFPLALPDDPAARWDHDRYQPDVILLHLGLADFLTDPIPDADYVAAYDAFLDDVRTAHPTAAIVLTEASGLSDDPATVRGARRIRLRDCLDTLVTRRHQKGDTRVSLAPLGFYPGTASDPHPVAFQHEQMALELEPSIRRAAGW